MPCNRLMSGQVYNGKKPAGLVSSLHEVHLKSVHLTVCPLTLWALRPPLSTYYNCESSKRCTGLMRRIPMTLKTSAGPQCTARGCFLVHYLHLKMDQNRWKWIKWMKKDALDWCTAYQWPVKTPMHCPGVFPQCTIYIWRTWHISAIFKTHEL